MAGTLAQGYGFGKATSIMLTIVAALSVFLYWMSRPLAIFLCQTFLQFGYSYTYTEYSCGISPAEAWIPLFLAGLFTLSLGTIMVLSRFSRYPRSAVSRSATAWVDLRMLQQPPINIPGGHGPESPEPYNQTSTRARTFGSMVWASLVITGAVLVLAAIAQALTP